MLKLNKGYIICLFMIEKQNSVMLVTLEPVSRTMAGPAIRCLELGKQLAAHMPVTLATPIPVPEDMALPSPSPSLTIRTGLSRTGMYSEAMKHDVLVIQSNVLKPFPRLSELGKYLAVDLYDPYLFAVLVQYKDDPAAASASYRLMHKILEKHMIACDFSMCASEIQRDYWLGRFCAIGRLNPAMYGFDPSLRKLIDVVPFGLGDGESEPRRTGEGKGIKGCIEGISREDRVLIWGGGIWDWFDPLTVIEAVGKVSEKLPAVKLFFMGWKSPNPKVEVMGMAKRARALAGELGLLDRHVFFGSDWIPYEDRVNYLLDADIAVSAHFDLPETRYSFRTRILDYLWCGLPVLSTGGDPLSIEIEQEGAGRALSYGDVQGWADAIEKLLTDENVISRCRERSRALSNRYRWEKTSKALLEFCLDPHHLPDYEPVTMPSLLERAQAVYSRGGKELVLKRSREILTDLFR